MARASRDATPQGDVQGSLGRFLPRLRPRYPSLEPPRNFPQAMGLSYYGFADDARAIADLLRGRGGPSHPALREACRAAGLRVSGTVAELEARLEESVGLGGGEGEEEEKGWDGVECGAGGDGGDGGGDGGGPGVGPGGRRHCLVCRRVGRRHCSIHGEAPDPLARPAAAVTPGLRQERQQGLRGRPMSVAGTSLLWVNQHTAQEAAPLELACTGCKAAHRTIHTCRVRLERSPAMYRLNTL